jgi:formylglycine-generating enzyme required for sulfatase activity
MGRSASASYSECRKYESECKQNWFINQEPAHTVELSAYYMDIHEVTNALYAACVEAGVCEPPKDFSSATRSSYYGNPRYDNYPVLYVSWDMAQAYCQWRGGNLPTEAQWEKAARGTDDRFYPWGSGLDCDHANFGSETKMCAVDDTTEVGSYPMGASPYGLLDMAGNVWEWVLDWYDANYYEIMAAFDPLGPGSGAERAIRGGSWQHGPASVQTTRRGGLEPDYQLDRFGFRCAYPAR